MPAKSSVISTKDTEDNGAFCEKWSPGPTSGALLMRKERPGGKTGKELQQTRSVVSLKPRKESVSRRWC